MFDLNGEIKLADFGTSKHLWKPIIETENDDEIESRSWTSTGYQGTLSYMAPELVKKWTWREPYSYDPFASDIWSLGVTIY